MKRKKGIEHLYDDESLTFSEIIHICNSALLGKLSTVVENITEKLDGQNLLMTIIDDEVKIGVGLGHILPINEIREKYRNKPNIGEAYLLAYNDLNNIFKNYPNTNIFQNGKYFLNMEILHSPNRNIIYYGENSSLYLHNVILIEHGKRKIVNASNIIKEIVELSKQQKTFYEIKEPNTLTFSKTIPNKNYTNCIYFESNLHRKLKNINCAVDSPLIDYYTKSFNRIIRNKFPSLSMEGRKHLCHRWGGYDRSFRLNKTTIPANIFEAVKAFDSEAWILREELKNEIRTLIHFVANNTLTIVENYICSNPEESKNIIRQEILDLTMDHKLMEDYPDKQNLILYCKDLYLKLGGMANFFPIEGIVFSYKNKQYKLVGLFSPINQLLGLRKYEKI